MDAPRTLCCTDLSIIMQSKLKLFVDMVKIDSDLLDFCLAAFLLKLTRSRWHYKIEKHRENTAWITSTQYNTKRIFSKNGYQSDSVESKSDVAFTFAVTFTQSAWYWYKSIQSYKATSLLLSLSLGLNTPLHWISLHQMPLHQTSLHWTSFHWMSLHLTSISPNNFSLNNFSPKNFSPNNFSLNNFSLNQWKSPC